MRQVPRLRFALVAPRRGKSPLEMLVVISVMSLVLGAVALTLTALLRIERQRSRDLEQLTAHARLGKLWRADAHAAVVCAVGQGDCTFSLPDGQSARYWIDGTMLRREVARATETEHRESFALPAETTAAFNLSQSGAQEVAALSIAAKTAPRGFDPAVRPLKLEAVVNLHDAKALPEDDP